MGRLSFICDLGYVVLSILHAGVGDFMYGLLSCCDVLAIVYYAMFGQCFLLTAESGDSEQV
jgi:hypothetical protein